jgi:hypothetical protein
MVVFVVMIDVEVDVVGDDAVEQKSSNFNRLI